MRIVILYRRGDSEAKARDYYEDFARSYADKTLELVEVDSPGGQQMAALYGADRYPAVLVIASDGSLQQAWQDELPQAAEVAYIARD